VSSIVAGSDSCAEAPVRVRFAWPLRAVEEMEYIEEVLSLGSFRDVVCGAGLWEEPHWPPEALTYAKRGEARPLGDRHLRGARGTSVPSHVGRDQSTDTCSLSPRDGVAKSGAAGTTVLSASDDAHLLDGPVDVCAASDRPPPRHESSAPIRMVNRIFCGLQEIWKGARLTDSTAAIVARRNHMLV